MTDEELDALHKDMMLGVGAGYQYPPKVAQMMHDRIEALIAERDAVEAKLAKAVEALEYYAVEAMPWDSDDSLIARTTLAEIKGESDAKSNL